MNDGHRDRSGAFVFGTLYEPEPLPPVGGCQQYTRARRQRRLPLDGVTLANSGL